MGRKRKYELRWAGEIKRNGAKQLVWVEIEKITKEDKDELAKSQNA